MRRSNWVLSTKPNGDYQTVYPIADFGKIGRAWRDDYETNISKTIANETR
jgi:hypothetical protein